MGDIWDRADREYDRWRDELAEYGRRPRHVSMEKPSPRQRRCEKHCELHQHREGPCMYKQVYHLHDWHRAPDRSPRHISAGKPSSTQMAAEDHCEHCIMFTCQYKQALHLHSWHRALGRAR